MSDLSDLEKQANKKKKHILPYPHRSRLVGEGSPSVEQRLADEEKSQQRQQDGHAGDGYRAHYCHQQLVTVPCRPPSHALGGWG